MRTPTWFKQILPTHQNAAPGKDHFDRIQASEQFYSYSIGGVIEGLGKFLQRTDRARYFDHPVAGPLFTPFFKLAEKSARIFLGNTASPAELHEFMDDKLGGIGIFLGISFKWASNLIAMLRYRKLAKINPDEKIIQQVSEGYSIRNICYLAEKISFSLAGGFFAAGHQPAAVVSMLLSQGCALVLAPVTLKANWQVIRDFAQNPQSLKLARDASKITGLNLSKGLWAGATLTKFGSSLIANPSEDFSPAYYYDLLVQNSWDLPTTAIIAGGCLMVVPNLLAMALDLSNTVKAPQINGNNGQIADSTPESKKQRRRYYGLGTVADIFNAIGGAYTASLLWQPLGALFNGMGSLFSFLQSRYKTRHHLT